MSLLGFQSEDERDGGHGPHAPRGTGRSRRPRWRGIVAILVALGVIVGGGVAVYRVAGGLVSGRSEAGPSDFAGPGSGTVTVTVSPGASTRTIAGKLVDSGVIATVTSFLDAAAANPSASSIQPGTYTLKKQMSAPQALRAMLNPASRQGRVSFPEGLTVPQTLALLTAKSDIPLPKLQAAAGALATGTGLPYGARSPEGFLFPSTYDVPPTTAASAVLTAMTTRYRTTADSVQLAARARALGMSPYQVLVIASLVQAEVSNPADQAKVARVLYNRVKAGMRLQLDSTVHYVTGKSGSVFTSDADRAVNSPYNTYRVKGLPPTPIDSPGEAALRAAVNPTPGPWLYYVTVNLDTGQTLFATTAAEHETNRKQLQQWCTANPGSC